MTLHYHTFDLRLKHTFTIAHDSRDVQPTLIVELREGTLCGYGEATSNKYYGISIEGMKAALENVRKLVEGAEWGTPEVLWEMTHPFLKENPFAQCALDEAAHDLFAKRQGKKLYEVWGLSVGNNPITDYTIGIAPVEKMVEKMREFPWPLYKIKLGTADDLAIVRKLRQHTEAPFRVDANCAWTTEQTIAYAPELKALGVEFIEQPLPAHDKTGMERVFAESALPVIADESCIIESDVDACAGLFHGINIKLTKCGGLTPARRMVARARKLGLKTMVGCMNESSVGISAIAQLLPLLDYVDMDGTLLIANDPAAGVTFDYGKIIYAAENGTGAQLKQ
ncbi:dipeptide epimerase [Salmonirosea aquatica]|uniref:Dipeptide epimerase n=1 Tax=Salmonirosea aquatica TaxID=2654236 RepID=A0A7C9FYM3_9BACT|nr:dipeptide epimerase [Cytophagaceae bacterium SJW1-29]